MFANSWSKLDNADMGFVSLAIKASTSSERAKVQNPVDLGSEREVLQSW
jgi:hypothetical protein